MLHKYIINFHTDREPGYVGTYLEYLLIYVSIAGTNPGTSLPLPRIVLNTVQLRIWTADTGAGEVSVFLIQWSLSSADPPYVSYDTQLHTQLLLKRSNLGGGGANWDCNICSNIYLYLPTRYLTYIYALVVGTFRLFSEICGTNCMEFLVNESCCSVAAVPEPRRRRCFLSRDVRPATSLYYSYVAATETTYAAAATEAFLTILLHYGHKAHGYRVHLFPLGLKHLLTLPPD
jgi:hypothetical protein